MAYVLVIETEQIKRWNMHNCLANRQSRYLCYQTFPTLTAIKFHHSFHLLRGIW